MKKKRLNVVKSTLELERGLSKASQRLTRAVELGVGRWQRVRSRSSKKKRDGAAQDALRNVVLAAGAAVKEATWAPADLLQPLGPKRDPRRLLVRALLPR